MGISQSLVCESLGPLVMVAQSSAQLPEGLPVPPRSTPRGRHRLSRQSHKPTYFTMATLAAFTVTGLNVPTAIGQARNGPLLVSNVTTALVERQDAVKNRHATALRLRARLASREATRASREGQVRTAQATAVEKAQQRARNQWVVPILHYRLTAGFGDVSGLWSTAHTGQDFAAPSGTPVRAVARGRIISASWDGPYGLKIVVEHPDGTITWYAHLSSARLTSGDVQAGDVIGAVGSTGNVTGPHLHFEVRPGGGEPVSPLPVLRAHGVRL